MNSKVATLEKMLTADRDNLLGSAPNLFPIHYQLNQLEAFRNQAMHQAKKASNSSRATLSRMFERLNGLIEVFDEYILDLAHNMLPIVRAGHPEVIVKLVKIAELEGKEDEKV